MKALITIGTAVFAWSAAALALEPGTRVVPERIVPVPQLGVSPQMQAIIGQPLNAQAVRAPATAEEWRTLVAAAAAPTARAMPELRAQLRVRSAPVACGAARCFAIEPEEVPEQNRGRLLLHLHGGAYVLNPGEAGTKEAVLLAGAGGYKVLSVDYRMPPDHPYPAAMDDAMEGYRAALATVGGDAKRLGVFGLSTGGGMTLALVLRARDEGLPVPGAIAPATPWADLAGGGDTRHTNRGVDNVLVSNEGLLASAAALYANGRDLRDPQLSPVNGDMRGFPPALLTSGTRDLFLSDTVRVHRALRQAGVTAELHVFEGQSHAQFYRDAAAPETREHFGEVARFFDTHLGR